MPCYDSQASDENAANAREIQVLRERCHLLARVACTFASTLEAVTPCGMGDVVLGEHAKEALDWWAAHKQFDTQRSE